MDSEFSYQYTHRAYEDVDEILTYMTQELQNPTATANFMHKLTEAIAEICLFVKPAIKGAGFVQNPLAFPAWRAYNAL